MPLNIDINTIKICPSGFKETFSEGDPKAKLKIERYPHIYCSEMKKSDGESKEETKKVRNIVTLTEFGISDRGKVKNAQAYFHFYDDINKKHVTYRHYNTNTALGQNIYGRKSTVTYEFIPTRKFEKKDFEGNVISSQHAPNNMLINVEIISRYSDGRRDVYFRTDNSVDNTYCQPFEPISFEIDADGKPKVDSDGIIDSANGTCISGNIRMLKYEDARNEKLKVYGTYKEWIDIKKDPVANSDAFFAWKKDFLKKLN